MDRLNVSDILSATGGELVHGDIESQIMGVSTDTRSIERGEIFFALDGKNFDGHKFVKQALCNGAVGAVMPQGKGIEYSSLNEPEKWALIEVPDTVKALGDLAGYYRQRLQTRFVSITGSNGKTTTKDMIYHVLRNFKKVSRSRKSFNNYIGVPLTIFEADSEYDFCVVEMGTNAPGEIKRLSEIVSPDIAILTNISNTHLEGLGSIEGVADAKAEFIENMNEDGTLIINTDDVWCNKIASRFKGDIVSFGFNEDAQIRATKVIRNKAGFVFTVNDFFNVDMPVLGRHNIYNSLAAIALCDVIGVSIKDVVGKFTDFKLPPLRMEMLVCGDITVINDGYNSNPSSTLAALDEFLHLKSFGRKIFVCGDMLELGNESEILHRGIGEKVANVEIDILWTVGHFSRFVAEEAVANGMPKGNVLCFETSEELCSFVLSQLKSKDMVLIKGSRGMKLEYISSRIQDCFSENSRIV